MELVTTIFTAISFVLLILAALVLSEAYWAWRKVTRRLDTLERNQEAQNSGINTFLEEAKRDE